MGSQYRSLGICIGASSIKVAEPTCADGRLRVGRTEVAAHRCDVRGSLETILGEYPLSGYDYACVTGRKSKDRLNLPAPVVESIITPFDDLIRKYYDVSYAPFL